MKQTNLLDRSWVTSTTRKKLGVTRSSHSQRKNCQATTSKNDSSRVNLLQFTQSFRKYLGKPLIREGLFIYQIIFFSDAICFKISKISAFVLNSANQKNDLVVFSEMQIFVLLYFVLYTLVNSKPM